MVQPLAGCSGLEEDSAAAAPCNRQCLIGLTDRYVSALERHDISGIPFASNVKFEENLKPMEPGEGLWLTAAPYPSGFAIHVPDPVSQQAGWMGVLELAGKPVIMALRLKLKNGVISEAEHLFAEARGARPDYLRAARAGLLTAIPEKERLTRGDLLRIGASYYSALDNNDGSLAPFAADCQFAGNGIVTAGKGAVAPQGSELAKLKVASDCRGQIDSQAFVYIDRIEDRRMIAADPVNGLAMGFAQFRHSLKNLPYKVTLADGSTTERRRAELQFKPFDMPAAHIFKIGPGGQIHEIEAVGVSVPYGTPTGWD